MPIPECRPLSVGKPLTQIRRVYAEQLADASDDIFCCPVCTHVLMNPVLTACKHVVCGSCQEEFQLQKKSSVSVFPNGGPDCPVCRVTLSVQPLAHSEWRGAKRLFLALLKKRPVRCLFHPQVRAIAPPSLLGHDVERTDQLCDWVGPLEDYDAHVQEECQPCRGLLDAW
jgi:hypothetical protein